MNRHGGTNPSGQQSRLGAEVGLRPAAKPATQKGDVDAHVLRRGAEHAGDLRLRSCGFCVGAQTSSGCPERGRPRPRVPSPCAGGGGRGSRPRRLVQRSSAPTLHNLLCGRPFPGAPPPWRGRRGTATNRSWRSTRAPRSRRARLVHVWRPTCDPPPRRRHPMAGRRTAASAMAFQSLCERRYRQRSGRIETRDVAADDRRPCDDGSEHSGDLDVRAIDRLAGHICGSVEERQGLGEGAQRPAEAGRPSPPALFACRPRARALQSRAHGQWGEG